MGTDPTHQPTPYADAIDVQEGEAYPTPPAVNLVVPVDVVSMPRVQELPNTIGALSTWSVEATGRRIVAGDKRRARLVVWNPGTTPVVLARTQADASAAGGQGATTVPAGPVITLTSGMPPLELQVSDDLYAASTDSSAVAQVCVVTEQWTM